MNNEKQNTTLNPQGIPSLEGAKSRVPDLGDGNLPMQVMPPGQLSFSAVLKESTSVTKGSEIQE